MEVPEVDIAEAAKLLADGTPMVDVRQPEEYHEGHVPGIVLVPLAEVPERVDEFPADGTVLIICRSGARSARAAGFLRQQGVDAVNVAGGTLAWIEAGHRVVAGDEPGS